MYLEAAMAELSIEGGVEVLDDATSTVPGSTNGS
jgi:hypothetical protein